MSHAAKIISYIFCKQKKSDYHRNTLALKSQKLFLFAISLLTLISSEMITSIEIEFY